MNSVVGPIFNESFVEKKVCGFREQCMRPTKKHWNALLNEKKCETQMHCVSAVSKQILSIILATISLVSMFLKHFSKLTSRVC